MQVSLADYNKLQQVAHHGHELIQVIAVQHGLRVGRSLCGVAAGALSRAPPALLTLFLMYVCVQQVHARNSFVLTFAGRKKALIAQNPHPRGQVMLTKNSN